MQLKCSQNTKSTNNSISSNKISSVNHTARNSITPLSSMRTKATLLFALLAFTLISCGPSTCQDGSIAGDATSSRHVVILLDKSASMDYLVDGVLVGFNNLVDQLPNSSFVTLFGFESIDGLDNIFDHVPARKVPELTSNDYTLGDGTPLYDAISGTISQIDRDAISRSDEEILFVIISDGLENSSVRYSLSETRLAIDMKISDGWDIRFYGLGADAASEAANLGIPIADQSSFAPSQEGVDEVFDDIAGSFTQSRAKTKCVRAIP